MKITCKQTHYRYQSQTDNIYKKKSVSQSERKSRYESQTGRTLDVRFSNREEN